MTRLADLEQTREGLKARMAECTSDQNYAVMGRLLVDVVKQIDEVSGADQADRKTGLSDFENRLRQREQRTKTARRTKTG